MRVCLRFPSPPPPTQQQTARVSNLNNSANPGNELMGFSVQNPNAVLIFGDHGIQVNWAETKLELSPGMCINIHILYITYWIGSSPTAKKLQNQNLDILCFSMIHTDILRKMQLQRPGPIGNDMRRCRKRCECLRMKQWCKTNIDWLDNVPFKDVYIFYWKRGDLPAVAMLFSVPFRVWRWLPFTPWEVCDLRSRIPWRFNSASTFCGINLDQRTSQGLTVDDMCWKKEAASCFVPWEK